MTTAHDHSRTPEFRLHHRLRLAREEAGLEQEELAQIMSVARNTISNCENGHHTPREITLKAWAMACGVDIEWLRTGRTLHYPGPDGCIPANLRTEDYQSGPVDGGNITHVAFNRFHLRAVS